MSYHLVIQIEDEECLIEGDPAIFFEGFSLADLQHIQNTLTEALLALEDPSDLASCRVLLNNLETFIERAGSQPKLL